ncbi:hypothetical protein [Halopiger thermotolerans]
MSVDDVVESLGWPLALVALNGSGWIARHTVIPSEWSGVVAGFLVIAAIGSVVSVLRAAGVDLEGGRCKAETNDGSRCRLERDPGADLCHVHQRTHDVTLHSSALAETDGFAGELERDQDRERTDETADRRAG